MTSKVLEPMPKGVAAAAPPGAPTMPVGAKVNWPWLKMSEVVVNVEFIPGMTMTWLVAVATRVVDPKAIPATSAPT